MVEKTLKDIFTAAMLTGLEATFENGHTYLDPGTSLFETLATVTAEEASRPVSANCASIAAHVEHIWLSMDFSLRFVRGERPQVDWTEIWRTVREVTPEEWAASQQRLREAYGQIRELVTSMATWEGDNEVSEALALLMHVAYHLGEIRQALCTVKSDR